jgi:DNA-binding beta-propeller fold protein YncE
VAREAPGVLLALLVSACCLLPVCWAGPAAASATPGGRHVSGRDFDGPVAISSDGTHVWVANFSGNSVTELDAATGTVVRVIKGPKYGVRCPAGILSDGTHVWVANKVIWAEMKIPAPGTGRR